MCGEGSRNGGRGEGEEVLKCGSSGVLKFEGGNEGEREIHHEGREEHEGETGDGGRETGSRRGARGIDARRSPFLDRLPKSPRPWESSGHRSPNSMQPESFRALSSNHA